MLFLLIYYRILYHIPGIGLGPVSEEVLPFTPVANIPTRQRLRSSTSDDLCVPAVRLPTIGRRVFSVAGSRVWNALPANVTSAPSLSSPLSENV